MAKNAKRKSSQEGGRELLKQAGRTAASEKKRDAAENQNQSHNSRKAPLGPNTER